MTFKQQNGQHILIGAASRVVPKCGEVGEGQWDKFANIAYFYSWIEREMKKLGWPRFCGHSMLADD